MNRIFILFVLVVFTSCSALYRTLKFAPSNALKEVSFEEKNINPTYQLNIQSPFLEQSISSSKKINIPAEKIWSLVSNWNRLNQFVPNVVERTEVTGKGINTDWTI